MVRNHNSSRPPANARSIETSAKAVPEGRVRCPSCGGTPKVLKSGRLSKHNDRSGVECPLKTYPREIHLAEIPPIVLPNSAPPPRRSFRPTEDKALTRVVTGHCHECDRPVSGERQFCGPCLANRGTL